MKHPEMQWESGSGRAVGVGPRGSRIGARSRQGAG